MEKKPFDEPRIGLNRIYTRQGDGGETSLAGGARVSKDSCRVEACGQVDELNSFLGLACLSAEEAAAAHPVFGHLAQSLRRIQHELFNLGSMLATPPGKSHPRQPRVTAAEVQALEAEIDSANQNLPALRSFVLPGGSRLCAELHACRAICRRAERSVVRLGREEALPPNALPYLNRLSDALFVWSRWANQQAGVPEVLWDPNQASSAR